MLLRLTSTYGSDALGMCEHRASPLCPQVFCKRALQQLKRRERRDISSVVSHPVGATTCRGGGLDDVLTTSSCSCAMMHTHSLIRIWKLFRCGFLTNQTHIDFRPRQFLTHMDPLSTMAHSSFDPLNTTRGSDSLPEIEFPTWITQTCQTLKPWHM